MKLVIDANEVFSLIIAKGRGNASEKLDLLFSDEIKLFAPALLFAELERNQGIICEKSGFSETDFNVFLEILKLRMTVLTLAEFSSKLEEAEAICPHKKDAPYFAVALWLNCGLWSGEKVLKEQSKVEVFNTKELVEKLGL